jgi:5-aminopentanamidase
LDVDANRAAAIDAGRDAAQLGADVVVLPELWQIAYSLADDGWLDLAIPIDGPYIADFQRLARALDLAILVTFLERTARGVHNTAVLIDRHGEPVLRYAKVHTCDFDAERHLVPGDAYPVTALDTRCGPVRVGSMICYDREFPEAARELMLGGAEVVLVPNACDLTDDRVGQVRARAFENMQAVVVANYSAPTFNGRSCAFDGIVFTESEHNRDHCVLEASDEPGLHLAHLDLDRLRAYRSHETWGDAYRKPGTYRRLAASASPMPPFRRRDARR